MPRRPHSTFPLLGCLVLTGATLLYAAATEDNASAADSSYRLFAGIELYVSPANAGPVAVLDIGRADLVVSDEAHTRLPLDDAGSLRAAHAIKLSRTPVDIEQVQAQRAVTPDKDRVMEGMIIQNEMAIMAMQQQARAEMEFWDSEKTRAVQYPYARGNELAIERGERPPYDVPSTSELTTAHNEDLATLSAAHDEFGQATANPLAQDLTGRSADHLPFDMLDLRFQLSTPTPVEGAYVVVIVTITVEGETQLKSFHQPVGRLSPAPRRILLRRAGLPSGYQLEDIAIHVYARGQELVTNRSAKNTPLSAAQVREYLLLSYLGEHATESLPAQPVWSLAPPALLAAASAEPFDCDVAVNIDADGRLISIHDTRAEAEAYRASIVDARDLRTRPARETAGTTFAASLRIDNDDTVRNQSRRVPPPVIAALRDTLFLPALDAGEPVLSTTTINLARFFP